MNFRTLLLAVLFCTLSSPVFAQDPDGWSNDLSQSAAQGPHGGWSSAGSYHDRYRRGYGYFGPDYACPQQSVIVSVPGTPSNNPQLPAARQQASDLASREFPSADNDSPAAAAPAGQDGAAPRQGTDANLSKPYAILTCGTFVRLEFASLISSKTAQVGDPLTLRVTDDIKVGNTVIVPRGALADGNITFVRRTGAGGMPGTLAYQLNALHVNGTSVPLWRAEGRSGDPKVPSAGVLIPVAGMFTFLRHGKDVELKPGIPVTAFVAADTTLPLQ